MNKLFIFWGAAFLLTAGTCSRQVPDDWELVKGGRFLPARPGYFGKQVTIPDLYMGKYEVTQKEWMEVMGDNPSFFPGDELPVESVSWYDCIEYCNKRSIKEGLSPYYRINKEIKDPHNTNELDTIKWTVTIHAEANGYRLPTEAEWEYAAGGGQQSKGYRYSGSDQIDSVAWYWQNAGDRYLTGFWSWTAVEKNNNRTKRVGSKLPNELGLYDMSGNVREWCWDQGGQSGTEAASGRIWKGGGWIGADFCCAISFRADHAANGKGPDQGFRLCRSSPGF